MDGGAKADVADEGGQESAGCVKPKFTVIDGRGEDRNLSEFVIMPDGEPVPFHRAEQYRAATRNRLTLLQNDPPRSFDVRDLVEWHTIKNKKDKD